MKGDGVERSQLFNMFKVAAHGRDEATALFAKALVIWILSGRRSLCCFLERQKFHAGSFV